MKILAFDTSTSACSCVLWRDGTIAGYRSEAMARGHSEHLMGMVRDVLAEAGAGFSDLDLLARYQRDGGVYRHAPGPGGCARQGVFRRPSVRGHSHT
ncbi:MAG: hypothetical protein H8E39_14265 [Alphaproteobacteria bacterium]|nr:hypothetical protein [Alphaproteobacteria bacterium]